MNFKTFLLFILAFCALPQMAIAQETYVPEETQKKLFDAVQDNPSNEVSGVINLFSNILHYKYPKYIVPVYKAQNQSQFIFELIPYGQDVKTNWTEMMTIQSFRGAQLNNISAESFANRVAKGVSSRCTNNKVYKDLGPVKLNDGDAHRVIFGCRGGLDKNGIKNSEITLSQFIKRNGAFVIVQYARRELGEHNEDGVFNDEQKKYYQSLLDELIVSN